MYTTKRNYGIFPRSFSGMMDEVMQNGWNRLGDEIQSFHAPVNIRESETGYTLQLFAPGLKKEDFKITVEKGVLTVSYDHKEETTQNEEGRWTRTEYKSKSFRRNFSLGDEANAGQITAKYQDGVLLLSIPKKEKSPLETKDIAVA